MRIQKKIMLGAVIFVLCAAAAYAQNLNEGISISSTPIYMARNTGRAELAGPIRLTANSPALADIYILNFLGIPITNTLTTAGNINVTPTTGAHGTWACVINSVDQANGVVTISCPAVSQAQISTTDAYFELGGVRVSVDTPNTAILSGNAVSVQVASMYNTIISPQILPVVIRNTQVGMVAGTGNATQTVLANGTNIVGTGKMFLKEGFASSFKTLTDEGMGATQATQILVTVAGLPAGVIVTMTPGGGTTTGLTTDLATAGLTFTSAVPTQKITITGESLLVTETLELDFTVSFTAGFIGLPGGTSYTATATLTPNDAALTSAGGTYPSTALFKAPKFSPSYVPQAILNVVGSTTTTFLIPYATTAVNYDTGIAIANSTSDPFGTAGGGAIPQNGTITFYFYPNDGTTITPYTTSASTVPGTGLTSAGVLNAGSTYIVLLSQLLHSAAPTRTASFSGYIIATVNASNCHGTAYISDFAGRFTSFTPALVIPNPGITPRSAQLDESLDF